MNGRTYSSEIFERKINLLDLGKTKHPCNSRQESIFFCNYMLVMLCGSVDVGMALRIQLLNMGSCSVPFERPSVCLNYFVLLHT